MINLVCVVRRKFRSVSRIFFIHGIALHLVSDFYVDLLERLVHNTLEDAAVSGVRESSKGVEWSDDEIEDDDDDEEEGEVDDDNDHGVVRRQRQ